MKSLAEENKKYWQTYKAGTTPGVTTEPDQKVLSLLSKTDSILDIGTGQGKLAESLSKKGYRVFAIDFNANEVSRNKKRKTNVSYSVQDISKKTTFKNNSFKLIIFRYVLTNIHKQYWRKVAKEVNRILTGDGYLWLVEPLVSKSYSKRYKLSSAYLQDKNAFFVFKDKATAKKVRSVKELQVEIKKGNIARIVRHYTVAEIRRIFKNFKLLQSSKIKVRSDAGYVINTFVGLMSRR